MKPFASLKIFATVCLLSVALAAFAADTVNPPDKLALSALTAPQSLPFAPTIPVNVTLFSNLHTHQVGPVATKRLDSFHHLGLDLDGMLGITADSQKTPVGAKWSNFAGLVGAGLSMSATWPKTEWYGQAGLSVTWNSGAGVGAGPYGVIGKRF